MYDSLLVLAAAAKNLEDNVMESILFRYNQDGNVSCENENPWMEGTTFFNYLNAVSVNGITGNISFEVSNLSQQGLQCVISSLLIICRLIIKIYTRPLCLAYFVIYLIH